MKILAIANISNTDDPACDSGVIFQRILAHEFHCLGIDYHLAIPNEPHLRDLDFGNATVHSLPMGTTRYASRFGVAWQPFIALLSQGFDIIFNNQVELTSALRGMLISLKAKHTGLVSYCHYPALYPAGAGTLRFDPSLNHKGLGLPIVLDILAASQVADCLIVQSNFARTLLQDAGSHFNISTFTYRGQGIETIPPPADGSVAHASVPQIRRSVVYNHRLYQSYGTSALLDFVDGLADFDIEFWACDPMPRRSATRDMLNVTPQQFRQRIKMMPYARLFNGNVDRSAYASRLAQSRIALAPWREACVWSMAAVDCMGLGVPVVAPRYASYPEFIPETLLFSSAAEGKCLVQRLLDDTNFWKACSMDCLMAVERLCPPVIAKQFAQIFEDVVQSRRSGDRPCAA